MKIIFILLEVHFPIKYIASTEVKRKAFMEIRNSLYMLKATVKAIIIFIILCKNIHVMSECGSLSGLKT